MTFSSFRSNELFFLLAIVGFANAVAGSVTSHIMREGLWVSALSVFGLNPIVLAVFALSLLTASRSTSVEEKDINPGLLIGVLLIYLIPYSTASWIGLVLVGVIYILDKNSPAEMRVGASILVALSLREPVSRVLLDLFADQLLTFDAAAAEFWLSMLGNTAGRDGNILFASKSHQVLVMTGCASFTNLSYALLLWFAINRMAGTHGSPSFWGTGMGICLFIPTINHVRLALMTKDKASFDVLHGGGGEIWFESAIWLTTILLSAWSVRNASTEKSFHSLYIGVRRV